MSNGCKTDASAKLGSLGACRHRGQPDRQDRLEQAVRAIRRQLAGEVVLEHLLGLIDGVDRENREQGGDVVGVASRPRGAKLHGEQAARGGDPDRDGVVVVQRLPQRFGGKRDEGRGFGVEPVVRPTACVADVASDRFDIVIAVDARVEVGRNSTVGVVAQQNRGAPDDADARTRTALVQPRDDLAQPVDHVVAV